MTQPDAFSISPGARWPCGAHATAGGVNFVCYSRDASALELLLYGDAVSPEPLAVFRLDPRHHRTFHHWHVHVHGAMPGLYYTWRADGAHDPQAGLRFDRRRELLDPWAREVSDALWDRRAHRRDGRTAFRARIVAPDDYDWEDDAPPQRALEDSVIYELHVRGFTRHESAGVTSPGTFRGLIEKIPYLQSLGITDIELLPVFAFDGQDVPAGTAARGLTNFWGYSPYGFLAVHPHFAEEDPRREFRDMVKAMHRAGIGVILDVVLNHTAEGGQDGPAFMFKGLANDVYYHLDPRQRARYRDYTGCGNTINANHPIVTRFLLDCLEYWVREMHVDGFRLDLASALARGENGEPLAHAPVLWSMELSEVLAGTKLIAEPWDAAGLYQVGGFPGYRWLEWNGQYRDTVRRYLRGEPGHLGDVATRLTGSSDLYAHNDRRPTNSVNFITCHDGFTLHDLVSYDRKHNEANGEDNRDGGNHDFSWNSGAEGQTDDPQIVRLREQRARNFMAVLLLSQGVPMLLAGDERLRTQFGNNNVWCQDNALGWVDWSSTPAGDAMLRFTRELIALRRRHASLRRTRFIDPAATGRGGIRWYGESLAPPDWHDAHAHVLCFTLAGVDAGEPALHVMLNMSAETRELPLPGGTWRRLVDTSLPSPHDALPPSQAPLHAGPAYALARFAVAVLEAVAPDTAASETAAPEAVAPEAT